MSGTKNYSKALNTSWCEKDKLLTAEYVLK